MIGNLLKTHIKKFRSANGEFGDEESAAPNGPRDDASKIRAIRIQLKSINDDRYSGLVQRLETILDELELKQIQSLAALHDINRLATMMGGEDQKILLTAIDAFESLNIVQKGRDQLAKELNAAPPSDEPLTPLEPIAAFKKIINDSQAQIEAMTAGINADKVVKIFQAENLSLQALYIGAERVARDIDLIALMLMTKAKIIANQSVIDYIEESQKGHSQKSYKASMKSFVLAAMYHFMVGAVRQTGKLSMAEAKSIGRIPVFTDDPQRDSLTATSLFRRTNHLNNGYQMVLMVTSLLDYNARLAKKSKHDQSSLNTTKRNLILDRAIIEGCQDNLKTNRGLNGNETAAVSDMLSQAKDILSANIGLLEGRGAPLEIEAKIDKLKQYGSKHKDTSSDFKEAFRLLDIDDLIMHINQEHN